MSKIRVLVLPSDRTGVGKFRSVEPHIFLQNQNPDDFHVDIDYDPKINDDNFWKSYDMVHFHRTITKDYDSTPALIDKLHKWGIVTVADIDDYWLPTKEHPAHAMIQNNKLNLKIRENLKAAQYVTTTTEIFAQEIKKFNKNVFVLPNAINPNEPQFKHKTEPSDKLRFGWLGGSSHLHDLKILDNCFSKLGNLKEKYELYLCGFDTRGSVTEIDQKTGNQKQRDIKPEETVWAEYEKIFTKNYHDIPEEYKKYLLTYSQQPYNDEKYYHRVWTQPVTSYAKNYAKFDVSLAPIKNHIFNRMKSQLKVIEAGFYKKAIIASNIGPYTIDLKHALKYGEFVDGNALLVNEGRNHSDWAKYIKKLVNNPTWAEDLGERLYETVKDTYDLNVVTKTRAEIYKTITK
jgi:glycosyltransferase involved in cell wall biosynthesis